MQADCRLFSSLKNQKHLRLNFKKTTRKLERSCGIYKLSLARFSTGSEWVSAFSCLQKLPLTEHLHL